ncbi:hypothetical protein DFA_02612 [Cavenderia fasciculata]|uniref:Uncharacterized protein n=1 Tax=Cavenderia fasciculata TaxID=261658 RepID=F4PZV9_CACFS|nr:uncharacterized protein DFA_02612 [Cavenderia fasciculata]EGG18873.1 hypothetical protein DFA_02612 [Cavenderia fasciculata]|eukprot:XP_004357335.1 hypothetical protein DFA_02612 [Cavenderia fasciculata]
MHPSIDRDELNIDACKLARVNDSGSVDTVEILSIAVDNASVALTTSLVKHDGTNTAGLLACPTTFVPFADVYMLLFPPPTCN